MKKVIIPSTFLFTTDKCYFCESDEDSARLRYYLKFSNTLKESTNFTKKPKFGSDDSRLKEEFIMCDNCRVYWTQTPESKQAFIYYRKIYHENRYQNPEVKAKQKQLNTKSYQKRKGN